MRLTTTAEALSAALHGSVQLEPKTTLPVLAFARLDDLNVITSNLDSCSVVEFQGFCDKHCDFLFPFHRVLDLIDGHTGPLTLEYIGSKPDDADGTPNPPYVKLKHGGCTFVFPTMSTANFPRLEQASSPLTSITATLLKPLIDRTIYYISNDQSRYLINGALMKVKDGFMTMAATDGHRLGIDKAPCQGCFEVIIPVLALKWLQANLEGEVSIGVDGQSVSFATGRKLFTSRILSGNFPNYQAVIPKDERIVITARIESCAALYAPLSRIAQLSDERSRSCHFIFNAGELTVSTKSERGQASASIPCELDGELKLGWNADYILEFLKAAGDKPLIIKMVDSQSAASFQMGDDYQYVIMPMRI